MRKKDTLKLKPKKPVKKSALPVKKRVANKNKTGLKRLKPPTKERTNTKSNKAHQPFAKQTDRNASGRFIKGNKTGKRFKSGVSGNPKGPPTHRIHLWSRFCKFMLMTNAQLKRLIKKDMTQVQHTALRLVKDMKAGKYSGSQHLARHVFDRDEGRPVEHVFIETGDTLSDEECEEIRQTLLKNHAD